MSNAPEREPARDDLCRSVPFKVRSEADQENDGFTLDGYGAVFNSPTRIDSWEGCFDETIAPGAFKKSLRERVPRMQFDHGHHPLIGSIPIGRFETVEEDTHGLHVVGRLSDNWLIEPVRQAIAEGGIDGMSFRFSVIREEWRNKDGKQIRDEQELWEYLYKAQRGEDEFLLTRTLKEVRVTEVGPVVWPAYDNTSVGVRSKKLTVDLGSKADLARAAFLIDAAVRQTKQDSPEATEESEKTLDAPPPTRSADDHSEEPVVTPQAEEHSDEIDDAAARRERIRARNRETARVLTEIRMKGDPDGR